MPRPATKAARAICRVWLDSEPVTGRVPDGTPALAACAVVPALATWAVVAAAGAVRPVDRTCGVMPAAAVGTTACEATAVVPPVVVLVPAPPSGFDACSFSSLSFSSSSSPTTVIVVVATMLHCGCLA